MPTTRTRTIQAQLAGELAALRSGEETLRDDTLLGKAAADAEQVLQALNVRYVVVHRDQVPPEFTQFVEQFLPVTMIAEDGEHALYQVDNRTAGQRAAGHASHRVAGAR